MVSLYTVALKNVRIDCALSKEIYSVELSCFFNEYINKFVADNFSLCFRVFNILKFVEETVDSVNINKVSVHLVLEYSDNFFRFTLAEKSVIYMHANKLLADCLYKKCCYN